MKNVRFFLTVLLLVLSAPTYAQDIQVSGTVTDARTAESVPFASIQIKGTSQGVNTDDNGRYSISIPADGILVFSFIGYKTKQVNVNKRQEINIKLSADVANLEEVLVVAYGTAKKESFSGSASTVRSESLLENPVSSFEQALQGKVAGMQVVTTSGQPGAQTSFRIRGSGSLNASNEPLYVIDGVATSSKSYSYVSEETESPSSILSSINPQDIESVTVLKDAAAASLYGSRAANGVVIITTKTGKAGEGKFNFNANVGVSSVPKKFNLMNSAEHYGMIYNSYYQTNMAEGNSSAAASQWANQKTQGLITFNPYNMAQPYNANGDLVSGAEIIVDTDWQKEVLTPGHTQDYNASFSGGSDKVTYFFSGGYFDQKGTSPTAQYTRYSGKANINAKIKPWLRAGMNTVFSHAIQKTEMTGSYGSSPLNNALQFPSGVPIYLTDALGNHILDADGEKQFNWYNPVSRDFNPLAIPHMDINKSKTNRLLASIFLELKFMEGLTFRTTFSPDYASVYDTIFWNKEHGNGPGSGGVSERAQTHDLMYTSTSTLNFNKRLGSNKHGISAMVGFESWGSTIEYAYAKGANFAFDFMSELAASTTPLATSSWTSREALLSYIARAEYDYDEKYYISASFRRDGSSVFGENNKWGNFYSVGGSWRIEREDFMKGIDWVDALKLRASYGTSGNNLGLDRYQSLGLWLGGKYNYGEHSGFSHDQFANPDLGWEKQAMFNIGFDYAFLDHRLYGSIEYYNKTSDDLLYNFPLPASHGISFVMKNLAKVTNNGFELEIGADIIRNQDFQWNLSFNISSSADKILDLAGNEEVVASGTKKIWKVGHSQYEFYMPTWMGVDASNGKPLWKKGDGTTSSYGQADYEMQGKAIPDAYGGFYNNFSWKGISLSFMIYYSLGGKVYDGLYAGVMHEGTGAGKNLHRDGLNAWTPENTNTSIPQFINSNESMTNSVSTRFLYDATYIKLKNVRLSYTLPRALLQKTKILSDIKIFFNADNLLTWFKDDWKGYSDIDIYGVGGFSTAPMIPLSSSFTLGLNLSF